MASGDISGEDFDRIVDPKKMVGGLSRKLATATPAAQAWPR